jgi:hypothetical protein
MSYEKTFAALEDLKSAMEKLLPGESSNYETKKVSPKPAEEAGEGIVVDEYKGVRNGDIVEIQDGRTGVVEHIMTGGTLGIPGSSFAIETSEENPGMTIRLIQDGEQTELLLNIQFTDVVV